MYRALATHRRTRDGYLTYQQTNPEYVPDYEYAPRRTRGPEVYDDHHRHRAYPSSRPVYDNYDYDYAPVGYARRPEYVDYPGTRVAGIDTYRQSAYRSAPSAYGSGLIPTPAPSPGLIPTPCPIPRPDPYPRPHP